MTKDLSKTLCELAGIESEYKYLVSFINNQGEIQLPILGKKNLIEFISKIKYKVKVIGVKREEIDFEPPENFVKLLEICHQTKNYRGLFFTTGYTADCTFYEAFMCNIISDLTTGILIEEQAEQLKQALQAQDWGTDD